VTQTKDKVVCVKTYQSSASFLLGTVEQLLGVWGQFCSCSYREFGGLVRSKPGAGDVLRDHKKKAASSFCKIGGSAVLRWI
jgi:hypothetical protein